MRSGLGLVKIGYAADPTTRMKLLQCGCPVRLEIALVLDGDRAAEGRLHRICAAHRAAGEWFREEGIVAEILAGRSIDDLTAPPKPAQKRKKSQATRWPWNVPPVDAMAEYRALCHEFGKDYMDAGLIRMANAIEATRWRS